MQCALKPSGLRDSRGDVKGARDAGAAGGEETCQIKQSACDASGGGLTFASPGLQLREQEAGNQPLGESPPCLSGSSMSGDHGALGTSWHFLASCPYACRRPSADLRYQAGRDRGPDRAPPRTPRACIVLPQALSWASVSERAFASQTHTNP